VWLFILLPAFVALGAMIAGVCLFISGAEVGRAWMAGTGGVLMFAGLMGAILLGAL
jgi:hypothetical protein